MNPVDIANLALGQLGSTTVLSSFDDANRAAQLIKAWFPGLRDAVLEDRDWSFAIQRYALAPDATPPAFDYQARFQLPSDVLRVISAVPPGPTLPTSDEVEVPEWLVEGGYVLTVDAPATVNVRAVTRVEDASRWSPGFCQALATRVAAELAVPLANDHALMDTLWKLYTAKVHSAAANDGRQGQSQRIRSRTIAIRRR